MADLLFKRPFAWRDCLRRYQILADGKCIGDIRMGQTVHLEISPGIKRICLRIDGYGSYDMSVLVGGPGVIVLHCLQPPLPQYPGGDLSNFQRRVRRHLPADRLRYLALRLQRSEEVARGFLQAAWSVARYQIEERSPPGERSRYGLTAGDLSVLYNGCRQANASVMTIEGSPNHIVWGELERIGWLYRQSAPADTPVPLAVYGITEQGRIELLEIFSGVAASPSRVR